VALGRTHVPDEDLAGGNPDAYPQPDALGQQALADGLRAKAGQERLPLQRRVHGAGGVVRLLDGRPEEGEHAVALVLAERAAVADLHDLAHPVQVAVEQAHRALGPSRSEMEVKPSKSANRHDSSRRCPPNPANPGLSATMSTIAGERYCLKMPVICRRWRCSVS